MKLLSLIIFIFFINCKLNKNIETYGVSNLMIKVNQIKTNITNQNDIISLFGSPLIKDVYDKNIWVYFEIKKDTNIFGNKFIILNDIVFFKFNNLGVLNNYETYDIKNLQNIEFDEKTTLTKGVNQNFIESVISSARKRSALVKNQNSNEK